MAMGSWVGPVFAYEWLTASRRWQGYALRSLLVLLLFLGLSAAWMEGGAGAEELTIQKQAEIGQQFYAVTTIILLGLVGLAAPAPPSIQAADRPRKSSRTSNDRSA